MPHWLRFLHDGVEGFGTLTEDDGAVAVHAGGIFETPQATGTVHLLDDVELLTPVQPGKIVALWNNSKAAAEKQKLEKPAHPLYFIKTPNSYLAPRKPIRKPMSYDGRVIYEAELGVVIGKRCTNLTPASAQACIFGYTCVNDVTALQIIREDETFAQWCRAKSFDTFAPFGPWITTGIGADQLNEARIRAELQGRERQNYPVSDLFYGPAELVALISRDMTLEPGDIISCGTGPGALPMKPGNRIEISIDGIGTLANDYVE